jgi:mannose-1-phosphate guanylyltransferase/mannose-6-phosphate isomerase
VARLAPVIAARDVYVVTHEQYAELVRSQLPDLPPDHVIAEPAARNTAAAVALAALAIDRPGDDVMVVLPADHRIDDEQGFRDALAVADGAAGRGTIVTLGIAPTAPEPGYGYVVAARTDDGSDGAAPRVVERFVEKPPIERAQELLAGGSAYWNGGIFVWRRDRVLDGLERHAPAVLGPLRAALDGGRTLADAYAAVPATSIDYALLEPASLEGIVGVVPLDVGWSDLGSWAALMEALLDSTGASVVTRGETIDLGSTSLLVESETGRLVVTIGLDGVVVIDTPDAVLVCSAERAQDVKQVVDLLAAKGRRELL